VLFAAYTLLCVGTILVGTLWALSLAAMAVSAGGLLAILLPPLTLSARQIVSSGRWADFLPLTALYFTYGLARARALFKIGNLF